MINFKELFVNKNIKLLIIVISVIGLLYVVLRLLFPYDPVVFLLTSAYNKYLLLPEWFANKIFEMKGAGVQINGHRFGCEKAYEYQTDRIFFLENWPRFLLSRNWSGLILLMIWMTRSLIRKKILYSIGFIFIHFLSIVSGLILLGVVGPKLYEVKPSYFLSPTLLGAFIMFGFLVFWLMKSKEDIQNTFQKLKLKINLSNKKYIEIIVVFFFLLLLRSFFVAFFDFPNYVQFLLETTRKISIFLYDQGGYIIDDQLFGEKTALVLTKHCLGFLTMYVFASLVYLTRPKTPKVTWIYILSGLGLIFLLNIARLVAVFVIAQGEDGYNIATRHHEIYNVVIYIVIFVLWIVWFEKFVMSKKKVGEGELGE